MIAAIGLALVIAEFIGRRFFPIFDASPIPRELEKYAECDQIAQFDRHTGWWWRPNLFCVIPGERNALLRTNSQGFRAEREFGPKDADVLRVGVFGDSFTFGALVNSGESYVSLIEQITQNVEVVNFGIDGGGPDQALLALRHKGMGLDLDVIILTFTAENIERLESRELMGMEKPYFTLAGRRLVPHNYPARRRTAPGVRSMGLRGLVVWQVALAALRPLALDTGVYAPYRALYEGAPGALLERILVEFTREPNARGATFLVAPLPTYHYIEHDLAPDYDVFYRRVAREMGATYVDVLSAFRRLSAAERRSARFRFDQHYTPLAHKVVARAIAPYVSAVRGSIDR